MLISTLSARNNANDSHENFQRTDWKPENNGQWRRKEHTMTRWIFICIEPFWWAEASTRFEKKNMEHNAEHNICWQAFWLLIAESWRDQNHNIFLLTTKCREIINVFIFVVWFFWNFHCCLSVLPWNEFKSLPAHSTCLLHRHRCRLPLSASSPVIRPIFTMEPFSIECHRFALLRFCSFSVN